jgi:hypothetical protein
MSTLDLLFTQGPEALTILTSADIPRLEEVFT